MENTEFFKWKTQSFLNGTRFELGHRRKPVEHEILL